MFSNVHYVILQMIYAEKKGYSPIVDMKYFPTIYNENDKVFETYNSWEYYFKNYGNIGIDNIYKYFNYKFSDEKSVDTSRIKKNLYKEYKKKLINLVFKKNIINEVERFIKKKFSKGKILGVHFRGSDQKIAALHPFPPTLKQMFELTDKIMKKKEYKYIFLVTEEEDYFQEFKKKYGKKLITYDHFRSKNDIFKNSKRKNHRYLLGYETIINMILLSRTQHLLHSNSNLSAMAVHISKKKIKQTIIFNGINSKNIFLSNILWYIKFYLPYKFGGFKNKVLNK